MSSIESETRKEEQQICDVVTQASIKTLVLDDTFVVTLNTSEGNALANPSTLNYPYIENRTVILSGQLSEHFSIQSAYQKYYQVQLTSTVHNSVKVITAPQIQELQVVANQPVKFSSNPFMAQFTPNGELINLVSLQIRYDGIYRSCVGSQVTSAFR